MSTPVQRPHGDPARDQGRHPAPGRRPVPASPIERPTTSTVGAARRLLRGALGGRALGRGLRSTDSGWVLTVMRPRCTLALIALLTLPGAVGCAWALSWWSGNVFAWLGLAAYALLLAGALAWYGTLVYAVRLDGQQVLARRLLRPVTLSLSSLSLVTVDDATRMRRTASGEWYESDASLVVVYADDTALICEEPRLANVLADRLIAARPRLAGRPGDRSPPRLGDLRCLDVGATSRIRQWGHSVVGPLATAGVAVAAFVWCAGVLTLAQGEPGPARPAEQAYAALRWPTQAPPTPLGDAAQVYLGACEQSDPPPWSGDGRNGEVVVDAYVTGLTRAQVEAITARAEELGMRAVRDDDPATTSFAREADGVRWVLAWHRDVEGDLQARFSVWTGCLDGRNLPDEVRAHLEQLADYALTGPA